MAAGRVTLRRRSMLCPGCGVTAYPADARVGLDGFLSPQATRLAALAAATWSFDVAAERLDELAGLRLDDETIRRHVHRAAQRVVEHRDAHPPRAAFAAASGEVEFLTDGVMAPTRDGWRELKLARFQVRPRSVAAGTADWAARELPDPTASVCYATTADCDTFAARWVGWATGLEIDPKGPMSVLADGVAWIWTATTEHFARAYQVLDIFHASQHLATAAAGLLGESTTAATRWPDAARPRRLADGWNGLLDQVGEQTPVEGRDAAEQKALGAPSDSGLPVRRRLEEGDWFDLSSEPSMNAANLDAMTPPQRTIVEQALILAQGLEATACSAPNGQIIDRRETLLLANGRDFLRQALEETLRARVEILEKKGRPAESACGVLPAATRGGRRGR